MEPLKISLDEYLGLLSLSAPMSDYMTDKLRIPHGLTNRQWIKMQKEADTAREEYHIARNGAIREYIELVESGEISSPSATDRMVSIANGHPDNESTKAARRRCEKMGICWDTKNGKN